MGHEQSIWRVCFWNNETKRNENEFGWKFTAQKGKRLLKNNDNKKRNTYVDIFAESLNNDKKK